MFQVDEPFDRSGVLCPFVHVGPVRPLGTATGVDSVGYMSVFVYIGSTAPIGRECVPPKIQPIGLDPAIGDWSR